jgi:hypothetical protein
VEHAPQLKELYDLARARLAEVTEAERSFEEALTDVRERLIQGESTGDRARDFAMMDRHQNWGWHFDRERGESLASLEQRFISHPGELCLLIDEESDPEIIHHGGVVGTIIAAPKMNYFLGLVGDSPAIITFNAKYGEAQLPVVKYVRLDNRRSEELSVVEPDSGRMLVSGYNKFGISEGWYFEYFDDQHMLIGNARVNEFMANLLCHEVVKKTLPKARELLLFGKVETDGQIILPVE